MYYNPHNCCPGNTIRARGSHIIGTALSPPSLLTQPWLVIFTQYKTQPDIDSRHGTGSNSLDSVMIVKEVVVT